MMQAVERPRFRHQDLVAELIEEKSGRYIDVLDPNSGNAFRFYEVEFSLACAMDGERDVAGIVQWAKDELGITPSPNEVRSVIATLGDLGFISLGAGAEHELAAGVVVGKQANNQPAYDVELGTAGTNAAAPSAPLPKAPDLALGSPGASAGAKAPKPPVEDVALGHAGAVSEVSIDLADHLSVKPDDVKEAVRQSKVMTAVEVPKELLEAAEERTVEQPKYVEKPAPKVEKEAKPLGPPPAANPTAKPADKVEAKPAAKARPPVELKQPAEKTPVAETSGDQQAAAAPRSGLSPVLIVLLILAICGAAVYFGWRYLIRESSQDTTATTPVTTPVAAVIDAPAAPPKPPDPTAKIVFASGEPKDVVAIFEGRLESVEGLREPKEVKQGDIIGRLVGNKRFEAEIAALSKDTIGRIPAEIELATKELAKAQEANNATAIKQWEARVADRNKSLETKQEAIDNKRDELEKLLIRAPVDGTITAIAKPGQKLAESDVVVRITPSPAPSATFMLPHGLKYDLGVVVGLQMGERILTCTVADSQPDGKTRVVCPDAADVPEGTEVAFKTR